MKQFPLIPPIKGDKETKSCYKNAMVGSITYYGSVPDEEDCPIRLVSHYIARMPEENYSTFRNQFEQELYHTEEGIDVSTTKVILVDGHKSIWGYVGQNPRFDSYEKLIDFYHTTEHLSSA